MTGTARAYLCRLFVTVSFLQSNDPFDPSNTKSSSLSTPQVQCTRCNHLCTGVHLEGVTESMVRLLGANIGSRMDWIPLALVCVCANVHFPAHWQRHSSHQSVLSLDRSMQFSLCFGLYKQWTAQTTYSVLILGLDNAGKTVRYACMESGSFDEDIGSHFLVVVALRATYSSCIGLALSTFSCRRPFSSS